MSNVTYLSTLIEWLEEHMLPCIYKKYLGFDCPGCGIQRSLISLLKGDFAESFELYPPLIFVLLLLIVLALQLIFDLRHGVLILKIMLIVTSLVMLLNFVYKFF